MVLVVNGSQEAGAAKLWAESKSRGPFGAPMPWGSSGLHGA